jgi:hypothetical protein
MFKFEYEIELNDSGRPYIKPVGDTLKELSFVEHKFMAMELATYVVGSSINAHLQNPERLTLPEGELERLKMLESEINRLSNIYANTIKNQFELLGIADRLLNKNFDITVLNEQERNALNYNGIIFDDRLFKREEGLKVKLIQTGQIFQLVGGIDNEHWKEIKE